MSIRFLVRIAVVVVALLAAAIAALAVFLPRIVNSDAVRERIRTAAEESLGRGVGYQDVDFRLFPPSLLVMRPVIAGASADAEPLVEAEGVALRIALAPLIARAVVVDSLVVEGARVHLVRTSQGTELPRPRAADAPEAGDLGAKQSAPVDLAVRGFALSRAAVVVEDRAVSPAVTWELRDVDARARGDSLDDPFALRISLEVASGGRVKVEGSATLDGRLDVEIELESFSLAPIGPYLGNPGLAGELSGTVELAGPAASPTRVAVDLSLREGDLRIDEIALRGAAAVTADLSGGLEAPSGRFDIDATEAEVEYGGAFTKPPGDAATLTGRIVRGDDGKLEIDDVHLRVRDLKARGSARASPAPLRPGTA